MLYATLVNWSEQVWRHPPPSPTKIQVVALDKARQDASNTAAVQQSQQLHGEAGGKNRGQVWAFSWLPFPWYNIPGGMWNETLLIIYIHVLMDSMKSPQACHWYQGQPHSQGSWLRPNLPACSCPLQQTANDKQSTWQGHGDSHFYLGLQSTQMMHKAAFQLELETSESCCQTMLLLQWLQCSLHSLSWHYACSKRCCQSNRGIKTVSLQVNPSPQFIGTARQTELELEDHCTHKQHQPAAKQVTSHMTSHKVLVQLWYDIIMMS
jgi:hypothetical protein